MPENQRAAPNTGSVVNVVWYCIHFNKFEKDITVNVGIGEKNEPGEQIIEPTGGSPPRLATLTYQFLNV